MTNIDTILDVMFQDLYFNKKVYILRKNGKVFSKMTSSQTQKFLFNSVYMAEKALIEELMLALKCTSTKARKIVDELLASGEISFQEFNVQK